MVCRDVTEQLGKILDNYLPVSIRCQCEYHIYTHIGEELEGTCISGTDNDPIEFMRKGYFRYWGNKTSHRIFCKVL